MGENTRLIYDSRVKQFIKDKLKSMRPGWNCKLVSKTALNQLEAKFRSIVIEAVQHHPTRGHTFKEV